jgi:hypothetical protein
MNQNNQNQSKLTHGGRRHGGGRRKGSTNKLTGQSILKEIAKKDKPFAVGLAEDYHSARISGDKHLIVKYQQMILNKVVADKVDVDHTTLGQPLTTVFKFPQRELPDWTEIPISITTEK